MFRLVFLVISFSFSSQAAPIKISEKLLLKYAAKGAPRLDEIEAAFQNAQLRKAEVKELYAPELFGSVSHQESNERSLVEFQPIFSPITQGQLGLKKNFVNGLSTRFSVTTDQRSSGSTAFTEKFDDATTTIASFTVEFDLWKDLLGKTSKAVLQSAEFESKRAQLQKQVEIKAFKLALRRIYWNLVANQESLRISEALLKTAESQAREIRAKFQNAVAEADEVARYQAQVSSRQGNVLYLNYQRETLIKQLRNLLPELAQNKIELDQYDLDKTILEVLSCTTTIAGQTSVPLEFTQYDEMVDLLRKVRANTATANSRYADADIKLFGTAKTTGVGVDKSGLNGFRGSYGSSFEDATDHNRTGYEVGVSFTLPLGEVKASTQRAREIYDDRRLLATINNTSAQVANTHAELVRSITLLNRVVKTQKEATTHLQSRLKGMHRKYQQARVSVSELVLDQDALLSSQLTTIDIQLQVLNVLFDYLTVFTETPCAFNRK